MTEANIKKHLSKLDEDQVGGYKGLINDFTSYSPYLLTNKTRPGDQHFGTSSGGIIRPYHKQTLGTKPIPDELQAIVYTTRNVYEFVALNVKKVSDIYMWLKAVKRCAESFIALRDEQNKGIDKFLASDLLSKCVRYLGPKDYIAPLINPKRQVCLNDYFKYTFRLMIDGNKYNVWQKTKMQKVSDDDLYKVMSLRCSDGKEVEIRVMEGMALGKLDWNTNNKELDGRLKEMMQTGTKWKTLSTIKGITSMVTGCMAAMGCVYDDEAFKGTPQVQAFNFLPELAGLGAHCGNIMTTKQMGTLLEEIKRSATPNGHHYNGSSATLHDHTTMIMHIGQCALTAVMEVVSSEPLEYSQNLLERILKNVNMFDMYTYMLLQPMRSAELMKPSKLETYVEVCGKNTTKSIILPVELLALLVNDTRPIYGKITTIKTTTQKADKNNAGKRGKDIDNNTYSIVKVLNSKSFFNPVVSRQLSFWIGLACYEHMNSMGKETLSKNGLRYASVTKGNKGELYTHGSSSSKEGLQKEVGAYKFRYLLAGEMKYLFSKVYENSEKPQERICAENLIRNAMDAYGHNSKISKVTSGTMRRVYGDNCPTSSKQFLQNFEKVLERSKDNEKFKDVVECYNQFSTKPNIYTKSEEANIGLKRQTKDPLIVQENDWNTLKMDEMLIAYEIVRNGSDGNQLKYETAVNTLLDAIVSGTEDSSKRLRRVLLKGAFPLPYKAGSIKVYKVDGDQLEDCQGYVANLTGEQRDLEKVERLNNKFESSFNYDRAIHLYMISQFGFSKDEPGIIPPPQVLIKGAMSEMEKLKMTIGTGIPVDPCYMDLSEEELDEVNEESNKQDNEEEMDIVDTSIEHNNLESANAKDKEKRVSQTCQREKKSKQTKKRKESHTKTQGRNSQAKPKKGKKAKQSNKERAESKVKLNKLLEGINVDIISISGNNVASCSSSEWARLQACGRLSVVLDGLEVQGLGAVCLVSTELYKKNVELAKALHGQKIEKQFAENYYVGIIQFTGVQEAPNVLKVYFSDGDIETYSYDEYQNEVAKGKIIKCTQDIEIELIEKRLEDGKYYGGVVVNGSSDTLCIYLSDVNDEKYSETYSPVKYQEDLANGTIRITPGALDTSSYPEYMTDERYLILALSGDEEMCELIDIVVTDTGDYEVDMDHWLVFNINSVVRSSHVWKIK